MDAVALRSTPFIAVHMYVPLSVLLTLVKMISFPLENILLPSPSLDHWMEGCGNPLALQYKLTESLSLTVLFIGVMTSIVGATKQR